MFKKNDTGNQIQKIKKYKIRINNNFNHEEIDDFCTKCKFLKKKTC